MTPSDQADGPDYATRSTEQLVALEERARRHRDELECERANIETELRRRSGIALIPAGSVELNYLTPVIRIAKDTTTGDDYSEFARRYAMRVAGLYAFIGGVLLILLLLLLTLA